MTNRFVSLSLADARQIISAGERKAQELGIPYNLAVVDYGGALIAHVRMDGAWLGSIDIAIDKAFTARSFDMSTDDLSKASQSGESLFGINTTNAAKVVIFGGGVPVLLDGVVVGAVGASGSSVVNDISVANAAAAGFRDAASK
jgi:uncharacterized protein GlcG (DUF336 family)